MEFRVLGPLEVVKEDRPLDLGAAKQRSLLALLLLNANEVVSTDRLIAELWGDSPPATVAKSVQIYVSRLRKELPGDRLATRPPGYVLRVDSAELDLEVFERLRREARGLPPGAAAEKLREALALWRGPPLADLAYEPFAQAEIARLEELRLAALEERFDADLANGRHADLVGELRARVAEHPLRERLRAQLMLTLYRSGRQAEALDAYRQARRTLLDELGLEPCAALKRLERAILEQDPALEVKHEAGPTQRLPPAPERSLLVVPAALDGADALLCLAAPLAAAETPREVILATVVAAAELAAATAALGVHGDALRDRGLPARTAAFSSPSPGADVVRLASNEDVDLVLLDGGSAPLAGEAAVVLDRAPCDVALMLRAGGPPRKGSVVVPFGAATHDWAALELAAWVARATGAPLRLVGAAADHREDGRDASRLLADASLMVQRGAGVRAEPLLASPGRRGVIELAHGAGLLVVGLSDRWRDEGLGRVRAELAAAPPAPTVFVRRGPRPGGLAPDGTRTRFGWSLTGAGA
jgi:DNA-binding SARP family transcriptional activator